MLNSTFDQQAEVTRRGLSTEADPVRLICERFDPLTAIDGGANSNATVCAPWDTFRTVEMLGLFDRDQVQHSPGSSTGLSFQIGNTALAGTDRQIKAEPIVFEQGQLRLYRAHTATTLKDAAVHVAAVGQVPHLSLGLVTHLQISKLRSVCAFDTATIATCSSLLLHFVVVVLDRPIVDLRERPLGFAGFRIELIDAAFDPVPMAIEFVVLVPVAREWGVTAGQVEFHLHYVAA